MNRTNKKEKKQFKKSKEIFKAFVYRNKYFLFAVLMIQLKSMMLLGMLRTEKSATISIVNMYSYFPVFWAHIAIITLLFSFMYLFKYKGRVIYSIIGNLILSIILLIDIGYYRINGNFPAIRHLKHQGIFNPLGQAFISIKPIDLIFFIDFIVLIILYIKNKKQTNKVIDIKYYTDKRKNVDEMKIDAKIGNSITQKDNNNNSNSGNKIDNDQNVINNVIDIENCNKKNKFRDDEDVNIININSNNTAKKNKNLKVRPDYYNKFFSLKHRLKTFLSIFVVSLGLIAGSYYLIDVKDITKGTLFFLQNSWAPYQAIGWTSPLGYHLYDILNKDKHEVEQLSSEDKQKIEAWFEDNKENLKDNEYKGMFKGKNVIALQVESLENFVVNRKIEGQEITPNINKLLKNSLYFNNIHEQNNNGTSADCDLLVNASVFPTRNGFTFLDYPWTKYNTIQKVLRDYGYESTSIHPELGGSWNWAEAHKAFGADKLIDINDFKLDEMIGLGLADGSNLTQVANKIKDNKEPYYTFLVTLSSHGPFNIPEKYRYLNLSKDLSDNILGDYFQSIRYADEQVGNFIKQLDENGQLENTVVMIYGDHEGVHKYYTKQLDDLNLEGDWWQDNDKEIPFIIYDKNSEGGVIETAGGQVDFMPTILYLLDVDREKFQNTSMGRVLVNTNRNATLINNCDIIGDVKTEKEENHLKASFKIAELIIKGDYFNQ